MAADSVEGRADGGMKGEVRRVIPHRDIFYECEFPYRVFADAYFHAKNQLDRMQVKAGLCSFRHRRFPQQLHDDCRAVRDLNSPDSPLRRFADPSNRLF